MLGVEFLLMLTACLFGFQTEHCRLCNKVLKSVQYPFLSEHMSQRALLRFTVERYFAAQPSDMGIGREGPHPLQQFLIDAVTVGILESLLHVVEHTRVVFLNAMERLVTVGSRIVGHIAMHEVYGFPQLLIRQAFEDVVEVLFVRHGRSSLKEV